MIRHSPAFILAAVLVAPVAAQTGQTHSGTHDHQMLIRGTQAMGFDQLTTTHHFLLRKEGGAIEITAINAQDAAAIDNIRQHLQHIEGAFARGDFSLPLFIHAAEPPGADVLRERRTHLTYQFEEIEKGARLNIRTTDPAALAALHSFLRYQITEHKTGDPLDPR